MATFKNRQDLGLTPATAEARGCPKTGLRRLGTQHNKHRDTLAERLRRRPAKPMGSPRVGSNPTGVVSETHLSILPAHMYVPSTVVATSINPILHIHPPPHPSRIHPHPAPTAGSWPRSGGACSASFGFGRGSVSVRLGLGSARLGLGSVRSRCVSVALLSWFGSVSVRLGLVSVRSHLGSGRSLFFLGLFRSRFGSAACDTQRAPTLPHPPSPTRSFPKVCAFRAVDPHKSADLRPVFDPGEQVLLCCKCAAQGPRQASARRPEYHKQMSKGAPKGTSGMPK